MGGIILMIKVTIILAGKLIFLDIIKIIKEKIIIIIPTQDIKKTTTLMMTISQTGLKTMMKAILL